MQSEAELIKRLESAGAKWCTGMDRLGNERNGWWLDGIWLGTDICEAVASVWC